MSSRFPDFHAQQRARTKIEKLRGMTIARGATPAEASTAAERARRLEEKYWPTRRLKRAWRAVEDALGDSNNKRRYVRPDSDEACERLFQRRLRELIEEAKKLLK